jgi:hypothetical protein
MKIQKNFENSPEELSVPFGKFDNEITYMSLLPSAIAAML